MGMHLISSNATIKAIKVGDKRTRLSDGKGLYLLLFVKGGSHAWRLDYSFEGRRKTLSFGTYPETTLALARRKAEVARVRSGIALRSSLGSNSIVPDAVERRSGPLDVHRLLQDLPKALCTGVSTKGIAHFPDCSVTAFGFGILGSGDEVPNQSIETLQSALRDHVSDWEHEHLTEVIEMLISESSTTQSRTTADV